MSKKSDEKAKHFASFLSSIAAACANVGILAPTIAYLFNISDLRTKASLLDLAMVYIIVICIIFGFIFVARKSLDKLGE
jgi:hypothetical protein